MISYDDIRQLQQYPSAPDSLILSLYLDIDQSKSANLNRGFETVAENVIRQLCDSRVQGDNGKKARYDAESEKVLGFLRNYTPRGRGLVIFSDASRDFWWHRDLQVNLSTEAHWGPKAWVRPLLEVLEDHDQIAIVLVDKQRARILISDATGFEQKAEILSDVPNKHVTTGTDHIWSQGQMGRDHTKHIKWHVNRVAGELTAIVDQLRITRIVVGGPVEATTMFTAELPKRVQQMITGTISVPLDVGLAQLSENLESIRERAEQQDEVKLVESMLTAAHKRDRGVLGIEETLEAIHEQRVYCLVVDRDYRAEGRECSICHVLLARAEDQCSFCGGKLEEVADLINRASHRVLDQAGKVQLVAGEAASRLAGYGIGAVLRF